MEDQIDGEGKEKGVVTHQECECELVEGRVGRRRANQWRHRAAVEAVGENCKDNSDAVPRLYLLDDDKVGVHGEAPAQLVMVTRSQCP